MKTSINDHKGVSLLTAGDVVRYESGDGSFGIAVVIVDEVPPSLNVGMELCQMAVMPIFYFHEPSFDELELKHQKPISVAVYNRVMNSRMRYLGKINPNLIDCNPVSWESPHSKSGVEISNFLTGESAYKQWLSDCQYHKEVLDFNLVNYRKGEIVLRTQEGERVLSFTSSGSEDLKIRLDILSQFKAFLLRALKNLKEGDNCENDTLFMSLPPGLLMDNLKYFLLKVKKMMCEVSDLEPNPFARQTRQEKQSLAVKLFIDNRIMSGIDDEMAREFNRTTLFIFNYIRVALEKAEVEEGKFGLLVALPNLYKDEIEFWDRPKTLSVFLKMSREEIERFWHLESLPQRCEYCLDLLQRAYRQAMSQGWDLPLETLLSIHQQFRENDYRNEQVLLEKCVKKHHLYIEITKVFTPEGIAVNLAAYDDKKKSLKASGQLLHFETERQFVIDLAKFRVAADNLLIVNQWNTPVYSLSLPDLSRGVITLDKAK